MRCAHDNLRIRGARRSLMADKIHCGDPHYNAVFIHYNEDYNTDHVAAHNICKTAARHCQNILMYQSNPYILADGFKPNFFVDISDYIDKKRRALNCYDNDHNRKGRLFETNIRRNEVWGYGNGVHYAEGFISIRYMCGE